MENNSYLSVFEKYDFSGTRIKGMYCDRNIALSSELDSSDMKACIFVEELGHHYTSTGNILNQRNLSNKEQEPHARAWAYDKMIGLEGIVKSYKHGCCCRQDMIEYLGLTEEFLSEASKYYSQKYGCCTQYKEYVISFQPLGVLELYK